MVSVEKGEAKTYYIGFNQTSSSFIPVIAANREQAREKFANYNGVRMSSFIVSRMEKSVPEAVRRMKPIV